MLDRLTAVDGLQRIVIAGGAPSATTIRPILGLGLATVIARKGRLADLSARVADLYRLDLPQGPVLAAGDGVAFMGSAPGAWLAVTQAGHAAWAMDLAAALRGLASVADQSDAYVAVRVSGPAAEAMLAQAMGLDLHPSLFAVGASAVTTAAHLGLTLWRREPDVFEILSFRSYADSFWHWLSESGRPFGVQAMSDE